MAMLSPTFLRKDLQSDVLPFLPEQCASREKALSLDLWLSHIPKLGGKAKLYLFSGEELHTDCTRH